MKHLFVVNCRKRYSCKHPGFTAKEVTHWAQLTGDTNPIHADAKAAKRAGLSAPIIPGLLAASVFPAIIGATFPGAIYLSQDLKFRASAQPYCHVQYMEGLVAEVVVKKISGSRITFTTACYRLRDKQTLVDGTAVALIKDQDTTGPAVERMSPS